MTQTCECGFLFVTDKPVTAPLPVICPRCGRVQTLQPAPAEPKALAKGARKEAEN